MPGMKAPTQRRAYAEYADMTLVRLAQDGDAEAFGVLYDRHNAAVYQYLWIRCGNQTLAQDLASDVWEKALRGIARCTYGTPIAWLMTIARNHAIDYFRSGRFKFEVIADTTDPTIPDRGASVEDRAQANEDHARLLALVKQLPGPQQEAIALTYFLNLSSPVAAAVMGKSPEAVKALTLRGRRKLASHLDRSGATS